MFFRVHFGNFSQLLTDMSVWNESYLVDISWRVEGHYKVKGHRHGLPNFES